MHTDFKFRTLIGRFLTDITTVKGLIDRLEERDAERGSIRRSSLKGRERVIVSPTNIGTVSKATLGKIPRDGVGRIWAFPSA